MAWFAVDSRWTRSIRWLYASRPARLGWYALAELANELRTPGIIPDARERDRAVADAARIRVSELRACVRDGLVHYADDGSLRLDGWLNAGEDRAPRAESAGPLPPKRTDALTEAQRAQRRAAGLARAAAAGRAGGAFVPAAQDLTSGAPAETASEAPAEPTSGTSGDDQRRPPAEPAAPLVSPLRPSLEIQNSKLKTPDYLDPSSPPSSGIESPATTATATATATGEVTSGGTSGAPAETASGEPAEPAETSPAESRPAEPAEGHPPPRPPDPPALRRVGLDPGAVTRAVQRGDLPALLRAFGCQVNGHGEEWPREADGLKLAMVAIILGWRRDDRDPIRLPSGFRAARLEWNRLTDQDQRSIAQRQVGLYHLPALRPPPEPATAGSG